MHQQTPREQSQETNRRVYYQNIVYHVCNALDEFYREKTVCGTAEQPTTHVQERLKEVLELARGCQLRERVVRLAESGMHGVWVWTGDGHDHPESLTCPVLISADHLRELLAKIPNHKGENDGQ